MDIDLIMYYFQLFVDPIVIPLEGIVIGPENAGKHFIYNTYSTK